jgi:hypothetical protein
MLAVTAGTASASDTWDRASQDFGNQNVGSTSDPLQFVMIAQCDAPAGPPPAPCAVPGAGIHQYGPITVTGPGFAINPGTDVCNARGGVLQTPIFPSVDTCTLQVTFKPTSGGVVKGSLSTATSPAGVPLTVALKGTGILTGNGNGNGAGNGNGTGTTNKKCKKKGKKSSAVAAKKCHHKKK